MTNSVKRCRWVCNAPDIYIHYHDSEWGTPVHDDGTLYEMLFLECFQAGLSWLTVLKKREHFRAAFDDFSPQKIAQYDEAKIAGLLSNEAIIRSRKKIAAAVKNAAVFLRIQAEFGSFSAYLWGFTNNSVVQNTTDLFAVKTDLSDKISRDLKARGMSYVGSVTVYSYLQAIGLVNDHETTCFRHAALCKNAKQ